MQFLSRGLACLAWGAIAELPTDLDIDGFLNRSSPRCWSAEFAKGLACWKDMPMPDILNSSDGSPLLDRLLSCCRRDDPECWASGHTQEDCCPAFLPQVLAKGFGDILSNQTFKKLRMNTADLLLVRKLYWSCIDFFPKPLRRELERTTRGWQTVKSALGQSVGNMPPFDHNESNRRLKGVTHPILLAQTPKGRFVRRHGLDKGCLIDLFSSRCAEHLPIFERLGVMEGPENEGEVLDFLGVSTEKDLACPSGTLQVCSRSLTNFFNCKAFSNNWGRLLPLLDEEYFEWADVLETAWLASQRGGHFAMAEVGSGSHGIWGIRAAHAFLRLAGPGATCDVLLVEPMYLDWRLLQEHMDRNLAKCRVTVVEAFMEKPQDLLQLLTNYSRTAMWDLVDIDSDGAEFRMLRGMSQHLLKRVRRFHISTHSRFIHGSIKSWFQSAGWDFTMDFAPFSVARQGPLGPFVACDGRLSIRPPVKKSEPGEDPTSRGAQAEHGRGRAPGACHVGGGDPAARLASYL